MNSLKFLGYIFARIGLMIILAVFGAFTGVILFPSIVTLLPSSMMSVKTFMINPNVESAIAFIIMTVFFLRIFYDDGKRHAAYESWSSVSITIVYLLMLVVYFIPVIFRDSFSAEGKGDVFYLIYYYPCHWLSEGLGLDYMISVLVGMGVLLAMSYAVYLLAFRIYVHKHPVILKSMTAPIVAEDEENSGETS